VYFSPFWGGGQVEKAGWKAGHGERKDMITTKGTKGSAKTTLPQHKGFFGVKHLPQ